MSGSGAKSPVFLFAGGGTGGHLYPGLAIAQELEAIEPTARCSFLCSERPIDAHILTKAGVAWSPIPARPLLFRPRGLAAFLSSWGRSVRAVRKAIAASRAAGNGGVRLVAMGGFVAAPAVQAARAERVPVILVNLDAVPGKANRWIARHAGARFTAAEGERVPASWSRVPPIVRREAVASAAPSECRERLGLDPRRATLLVTGGSQGAGSVNDLLREIASSHAALLSGWQVFHQAGPKGGDEVREAYARSGIPARVVEFCAEMREAWGAADAAVSRCGAGAVAEVWANRVPSIFLPYPYHRDQHQRHNALVLEQAGGALIVEDLVEPEETLRSGGLAALKELLQDPARRAGMREALARLGPADGARRIAEHLLGPAQPHGG